MMIFRIGYRNILRNRRRSAMTGLAVAVGTLAVLLFGGFQRNVFAGLETGAVQRSGHLTAFRQGYFLYGAGNPSAYGIDDSRNIVELLQNDPVLQPLVNVVTPTLSLVGIAGNYSGQSSAAKTFLGIGFVPSDHARMRQWNEHHVRLATGIEPVLKDDEPSVGFVGLGLGRILGLCGPLRISNCPPPQELASERPAVDAPAEDFKELHEPDLDKTSTDSHAGMPRLDLLGATAAGAPNVVGFYVASATPQGVKELDENVIGMPLPLAQQLVYGRQKPRVTGITVQLHRTEDLEKARERLTGLFHERGINLEVHDFADLNPFYVQVKAFFGSLFLFIAAIMVLGALGATVGVAVAALATFAINHAGLEWTPPANAQATPFQVELWGRTAFILSTWIALTLIATLAAWFPANRAAKLQIVDALRHV